MTPEGDSLSDELVEWMATVYQGLDALGHLPVEQLDAESIDKYALSATSTEPLDRQRS